MHNLQITLLKRLYLQNNQRYGTLAAGYDFEDNVIFHLNKLISGGLITKDNRIYTITLTGVKEVAKFISVGQSNEPFAATADGVKSFFIGFLCVDEEQNFLIKSHPNARINFYNLPSGKPFFGEKIEDALPRAFKLNTGLDFSADKFKFISLHLKTMSSSLGEVIFDDAFTIYSVEVTNDQKNKMNLLNSVSWKSMDEIKTLQNKWPEIDICILKKDFAAYKCYWHVSDYIL